MCVRACVRACVPVCLYPCALVLPACGFKVGEAGLVVLGSAARRAYPAKRASEFAKQCYYASF